MNDRLNEAVPGPHEQPEKEPGSPDVAAAAGAAAFPDLPAARAAMEAGQIGIWSWDIDSGAVRWSGNMENIHDLPHGSFGGTFSSFQKDIHADDRAEVQAAIQESLHGGKAYHVQYRLTPRPEREERWVEAIGNVDMADGKAVRFLGVCRDVSDRVRLLRELRARAKQQEAVAGLSARVLTEVDLQKLFEEIVAAVAEILDVEFVKILELVPGDAELLLRAGVGWKPGSIGTAHESTGRHSQAGYVLASGGPVSVIDLKAETRFAVPALLRDHGVTSGVSVPIAGRDGRAYGVLGAHTTRRRRFAEYDVSFLSAIANVIAGAIQRRQLDQRQELMIRELRHRSGNLFSQLLALFSQTAKTSRNVPDLVTKYEARVLALANAHRLITEGGWKATSLTDLLRALLGPYLDRVSLEGPDVFLEPDPSFALSTALHELATNAGKYGSLSTQIGRLDLSWSVGRTALGLTLALDWKESGGPVPKRVRKTGFGTRLVTMVIERQLNGEVHPTFTPRGLEVHLVVPLTHERWPGRVVRPASEMEMPAPAAEQAASQGR
jgi:two-component sensor histidine kinase